MMRVTKIDVREKSYLDKRGAATRVFINGSAIQALDAQAPEDGGLTLRQKTRAIRQRIIPILVTEIKALVDRGVQPDDVQFSSHAGCSMCHCSPGWVIRNGRSFDLTIYVTVDDEVTT